MSGCGRLEAWVAGSDGGHQDGGVDGGRQDGGGVSGGGRQDGRPILVHPQEALHAASTCHCPVVSLSEDAIHFPWQYHRYEAMESGFSFQLLVVVSIHFSLFFPLFAFVISKICCSVCLLLLYSADARCLLL